MEKGYSVSVDFTMSKTMFVTAENEEEAIKKANELINHNPYDYARCFSHYVSHEVVDVTED